MLTSTVLGGVLSIMAQKGKDKAEEVAESTLNRIKEAIGFLDTKKIIDI